MFCGARAAFLVRITAFEAPVPLNTKVTVQYGAGTESYELGGPDPRHRALFCEAVPINADAAVAADAAADAGAGPTETLVCELWTEGAATITVQANGYPQIERELEAKRDRCGIATVEVLLTLQPADAAP